MEMGKECRLKNRHNYLWICFSQEYKHLSNQRSVYKKYRVSFKTRERSIG